MPILPVHSGCNYGYSNKLHSKNIILTVLLLFLLYFQLFGTVKLETQNTSENPNEIFLKAFLAGGGILNGRRRFIICWGKF